MPDIDRRSPELGRAKVVFIPDDSNFFLPERRRNVAQVRRSVENALFYRALKFFALHEDFLTICVDIPDWESL
jgi:hypothetical protein